MSLEMVMKRILFCSLALLIGALVGSIACSEAHAPGNTSSQTSSAPAQSSAPATQPGAPAAQAATPAGPEPANVAEIFPAGQGRDLVLNNCGSCHNLACSAI